MKKLITITLCAAAFSVSQVCTATELDTSVLTSANVTGQQALLPDNEIVSYGLLPNPFKIITKTATAPIRAAKSKINAARKAAKLAKKGVNTVKGIDGDAKGKGPSVDYEKTPYTKDKYYRISKDSKSSKKSSRDRYEDYEFETDTTDTYESPYAKKRTTGTITTTQNQGLNNPTIIVEKPKDVAKPNTNVVTQQNNNPAPAGSANKATASSTVQNKIIIDEASNK